MFLRLVLMAVIKEEGIKTSLSFWVWGPGCRGPLRNQTEKGNWSFRKPINQGRKKA